MNKTLVISFFVLALISIITALLMSIKSPVWVESVQFISEFDEKSLVENTICISPDGRHIAYKVHMNDKSFVVLDGKKQKEYENLREVASVSFGPDGNHFAYEAEAGGKWFAVVDGREYKKYDEVLNIVFSPDGKRVAYMAREGNQWFSVVDGHEGERFDLIGGVIFSPDSKRTAYEAMSDDKWFAVVDGQKWARNDQVWTPQFSPDSKHVACVSRNGKRFSLIIDGKQSPRTFSDIDYVLFTDDGHAVYTALSGKSWFIVTGDKTIGPYDQIETLTLNSEVNRLACLVKIKDKWATFIDGKHGPKFDEIESFTISPDGKRFAYMAKNEDIFDTWYPVIDGKTGESFIIPDPYGSESIFFSPDSKRVGYSTSEDHSVAITLEGIKGKIYSRIYTMEFSPDSRHFAFIVDDQKQYVVLDDKEGTKYDKIVNYTISFNDSDSLYYFAITNSKIYFVKNRLSRWAGLFDFKNWSR